MAVRCRPYNFSNSLRSGVLLHLRRHRFSGGLKLEVLVRTLAPFMKYVLPLLMLLLMPLCGLGENLAPNPSFETGTVTPANWTLSYPGGQLQQPGRSGSNSVSLAGNGFTMSSWFTSSPQITNGQTYALRFWCRATNALSGFCFGGFNSAYSDFPRPGDAWTNHSMVAWLPSVANPQVQIGQVVVNGSLLFDDVELYRVTPVHRLTVGRSLGAGEKIIPGRYTFRSGFGNYGGSYSRCIRDANTQFAGFRWYMNNGSAVVHRHEFGGLQMTNATMEAAIWNYHGITDSTLVFDVSTNGLDWTYAGAMNSGSTNAKVAVPANMLPATEVFVRLHSTNPLQFSLTQYSFTADVPENFVAAEGVSYFFEQRKTSPQVTPLGIADSTAGRVVNVLFANPGGTPETFSIHSDAVSGGMSGVWNVSTNVGAGQSNVVSIFLPLVGGGDNTVTLSVTNGVGSNIFNTVFVVPAPQSGAVGNLVSNPSFELGTTNGPSDWYGINTWQNFGHSGSRSASFTGNGTGAPGVATTKFSTEPGETYAIHYWTMATNSLTGAYLGGFNSIYRDFPRPPETWVKQTVIATLPVIGNLSLVLGGVQLSGTTFIDDVELYRTVPVHKQAGARVIGAGEKLEPGRYTFHTPSSSFQYCDYAGNYSRSFVGANTSFAGFRWYMNPGTHVVHRHEVGGLRMTNAVLTGKIWNYHAISNTTLEVDVSTNGVNWQSAGQMSGTTGDFPTFEFNAPTNLFPTPEVHVRFRSHNPQQFSLMDYSFVAGVPDNTDTGTGETYFFEPQSADAGVKALAIADRPLGRVVTLALPNSIAAGQTFIIQSQAEFNGHVRTWTLSTNIPANQTTVVDVVIPTAGYGENRVGIIVVNGSGTRVFDNTFATWVTMLADDSYGERLPSPSSTPVWWCEGTFKVGRTRAQPIATGDFVEISAARNEYEPFQLALRPEAPMTNVSVGISDFARSGGGMISSTNVTLTMVEYVPVTELHNALENCFGDTADPLVPLTGPFNAPAHTNTTVWFTVQVPKDVPGGIYIATVNIAHTGGAFTVPVRLKVYDFSLSDATHTDHHANVVIDNLWHQPKNDTDRRAIWDLYLQNMARHRTAPYMAQTFAQFTFTYDPASGVFNHDFTDYDAALSRYLDDFHFTVFQWVDDNRETFGVGNVQRYAQDAGGNRIINPAFKPLFPGLAQPVMRHLIEKGWFEKAYSYWIDEPQLDTAPATLAMVKDGFQMIGAAVPGLKRQLPANTFDFPKPDLYGDVDIWVPAFDPWSFKHERNVERQKLGEKVWPYVFVHPFSPWPNNFTDQTAASPRIRFWMGEKLNWDGENYWGINYYFTHPVTGSRNPWTTPFVRDGNFSFGNSDGAVVFPPVKEYPTNTIIAGPIDSVRWEMLREGMEDREYFWLLKTLIAEAEARLGTNHPSVIAARATKDSALAFVPFPPVHPYEPDDIYASREAVALAIEALDDGRPVIASQPVSKACKVASSEYLQAEAIGWPLPALQWQHAGTNIPGGTSARLWLNDVTTNRAGSYRMIASNSSGSVTSTVVNFTVYGPGMLPQIIRQPVQLESTNGGRARFVVVASSATPLSYQWLFNGVPIAGATNMVLLFTNLNVSHVGSYTVTVSNSIGAVTSVATTLNIPLVPVLSARMGFRGFRITISSLFAPGQVQYSTNLSDWQVLTNLPTSAGSVLFVDSVTNAPSRFYRVVIPP